MKVPSSQEPQKYQAKSLTQVQRSISIPSKYVTSVAPHIRDTKEQVNTTHYVLMRYDYMRHWATVTCSTAMSQNVPSTQDMRDKQGDSTTTVTNCE